MDEVEARLEEVPERGHVREYVAFVRGAVRRHKKLVAIVFVLIVAAATLAVLSLPKSYHVEAKVLAHSNSALTVRGDNAAGEMLTRTAAETILRRDNLVSIVEQYDLVNQWQLHRSPAERARDAIMGLVGSHDESEQDRIDAMVERLEKKLTVWTNDNGGTISIGIDWPDPQMACRIVDTAQQNYLESRHAEEITALAEAIGILDNYAHTSKADVDEAVATVNKAKTTDDPKAKDPPPRPAAAVAAPAPRPMVAPRPATETIDPRVSQLQVKIEAKKRSIDELEDFRHRRVADLQSKLADDQAVYTEAHPAVVDLKQAIAAMSAESPQVKALRAQIAALESEREGLSQRHADPDHPPASQYSAPSLLGPPSATSDMARLEADLREERDPTQVYARGQLRDAMDKYAGLRSKIQAAQIDYDTAQAAFKYRYSVVTPAHVPKRPSKPDVPKAIAAAIVGAMVAAIVLAVLADLRSGRLLEPWQLERLINAPILGEVEVPRLPEHRAT